MSFLNLSAIRRVLIVDDERQIGLMLVASLAKLGKSYAVEVTLTPQEAVERLNTQHYHLVLTDYYMPQMNGLELAQVVRQISPSTQIILMTAYSTTDFHYMAEKMRLKGVIDGFIDKPTDVAEIREVVRQAVERSLYQSNKIAQAIQSLNQLEIKLQTLRINTEAQCTLLLRAEGHVMAQNGGLMQMDLNSIGALVTANFMTAAALGQLLGQTESVFQSAYIEGTHHHLYVHMVNEATLLAVILGANGKAGMVRFYTQQTALVLLPLLQTTPQAPFLLQAFSPPTNETEALDRSLDEILANFFASENA